MMVFLSHLMIIIRLLVNDDDLRESMSIMSLKNAEKYKIEVAIGDKWKRLIESI